MKRKILSIYLIIITTLIFLIGCSNNSKNIQENNTIESIKEVSENSLNKIENSEINISIENDSIINNYKDILENSEMLETNDKSETIKKEFIDLSSLEEIPIQEGLYNNIDILEYLPKDNFEITNFYEDILKLVISQSKDNTYILVDSDIASYELYIINNKLYSCLNDFVNDMIYFSYGFVEENEYPLNSSLINMDYSKEIIKNIKYIKSLIDKNGKIFDVIEVVRIEGFSEDTQEPILKTYNFYIERNKKEVKAIEYEKNEIPIISYINKIKEIVLPIDYELAIEYNVANKITLDEAHLQMSTATMMILMEKTSIE